MINVLSVIDICTEPAILKIILFIQTILKYVFIMIPIGVILMTSLDLFKNVIANKEDEMKKNTSIVIKRFIYCIVIFLVPSIVNLTLNIVNDVLESEEYNYLQCFKNTENIDFYEELAAQRKQQEEEELKRRAEEARLNFIEEKNIMTTATTSNTSDGGTFIGQKYSLTETHLKGLAMQCQREQGTVAGAAAEASLMANRFELFGSKYGKGGAGLFNYVYSSGWFANSKKNMVLTGTLKPEILTAVKNVLVLGNRTLPLYVDEHDCIYCGSYGYDIEKIENGKKVITVHSELKNHDNYIKDVTVIYNKYGSVYTFYTFPTKNSDPFGYTIRAKNKIEEWTPN